MSNVFSIVYVLNIRTGASICLKFCFSMLCVCFSVPVLYTVSAVPFLKFPYEQIFILTLLKNLINNFFAFYYFIRTIVDYYTLLYVLCQAIITKKHTPLFK